MPTSRRTRTPSWRAPHLLVMAIVVALLLPAAAVSAAPGRARATASLSVSKPMALKGDKVVLSGRLPAAARSTARLERRTKKQWVPVAAQRASAAGAFRFVVKAKGASADYRVRVPQGRRLVLGTGVTPVRSVQVVPRAMAVSPAGAPRSAPMILDVPGDGDLAAIAVLSSAVVTPTSLATLTDAASPTTTWSVPNPVGTWVQLSWPTAHPVTTVTVAGAPGGAQLASATVLFSDGSSLPFGAVLPDPTRPTMLSFPAKTVTWARLRVDTVTGSGPLVLADLATYQRGAPARTVTGAAAPPSRSGPTCTAPVAATPLAVMCPTYGASVGDDVDLRLRVADGYDQVSAEAWSGNGVAAAGATRTGSAGRDGLVTVPLDLRTLPGGPVTVRLVATGRRAKEVVVHLQLLKDGRPGTATSAVSPGTAGRTLVFQDDFTRQPSTSRTGVGADYASSKPERTYGADFGSAIFADPAAGLGNMTVVQDDLLKMSALPRPADVADPQGWGREHVGAMLASARPGGSGFSAQYGYFEARMLLPAGAGTWPAFWMLPNPNLVAPQEFVAEIDALEHYGQIPTGACHTTHQYPDPTGIGVAQCSSSRWGSTQEALSWHTFGADVRADGITFYVDGRKVSTERQVKGGDQPLFWLLDMSLGGGWDIDLAATRERADLYVDWVRVYV